MITIKISADTLFYLLGKNFSIEACEAICDYCEECGEYWKPSCLRDIINLFCEIPTNELENDDLVITKLSNGNSLLIR